MTRKQFLAAETRCVAEVSSHQTETPALPPIIWTKCDAHQRMICLNILNIRCRTGSHFSQASAASPHYYAAQTLFVCIQLYCSRSMAFGGISHSWWPTQCHCCQAKGRKSTMGFQEARPWYHLFGFHTDVMLNQLGMIMWTERIILWGGEAH